VTADPAALQPFTDVIRDEVNVRSVVLESLDPVVETQHGVVQTLTINARVAGPRLGSEVQSAIKASKSGDWSTNDDGTVTAGGTVLLQGEFAIGVTVHVPPATINVTAEQAPRLKAMATHVREMLPGGGFVVLDVKVTPELAREGLANDLVRAVQQTRRNAGLHVSDRISLTITGDEAVFDATVAHRDHLVAETLATQFGSSPNLDDLPLGAGVAEVTVGDGHRGRVQVRRA
jgi:isoleucyl-tRNA synthetase